MISNNYTAPSTELILEEETLVLCASNFSGSGSSEGYDYDGDNYNELD